MGEVRQSGIRVLEPGVSHDPYHGIEGAEAIVAGVRRYGTEVMNRAPDLKVIARTGIGYDSVNLRAATERGIYVCNVPDGPTVPAAEHTVALLMAVAKDLGNLSGHLRRDDWGSIRAHTSVELSGKLLGLVGFGRIAHRVASVAAALDMEVTAYDPFLTADQFGSVTRADTLEELVAGADVVSIHVPLTDGTRQLFDHRTLQSMKDGAILINAARGGLVDTDALVTALSDGPLRAAGLDVTDPEPLPAGHPLFDLDNVLITPHAASWTKEAQRRMLLAAVSEARLVLSGQQPFNLVNPEVLKRPQFEPSRTGVGSL